MFIKLYQRSTYLIINLICNIKVKAGLYNNELKKYSCSNNIGGFTNYATELKLKKKLLPNVKTSTK